MFHQPAWAVSSYSSGHQPGELPKSKSTQPRFASRRNSLYSFYRPVLVLLDRQFDLATPLHHTWTYQAMAHDVLKYSLNRVTLVEEATPSSADGGPSRDELYKNRSSREN